MSLQIIRLDTRPVKWFIAVIFALFISATFGKPLKLQGKPLVRHFTPFDYKGHEQNWAMLLAPSGLLYVGNGSGILEYDGSSWRKINTPFNGRVRSLVVDEKGRIYAGAHNSFGYLQSKNHLMEYVDLSQSLPSDIKGFGDIWSAKIFRDTVYFASSQYLFRLNSDGSIQHWKSPNRHFRSLQVIDDEIYIITSKELYKMTSDERLVETQLKSQNESITRIVNVITEKNKSFIITTKNIYLYDKTIEPWTTPAVIDLTTQKDLFIYTAQNYNQDYIAIGTIGSGVYLIRKDGSSFEHYDLEQGLPNNIVLSSVTDNQNGLWLGLDGAIARIQSPLNISITDLRTGLEAPNTLLEYDNTFLVGTSVGIAILTKIPESDDYLFKKIPNFNTQTIKLINTPSGVLSAGVGGVFRINWNDNEPINSTIEEVIEYSLVYDITPSIWSENEYIVTLEDGIGRLIFKDNQWRFKKTEGLSDEINKAVFNKLGLWLASTTGKVYFIKSNEDLENGVINVFAQKQGIPKSRVEMFLVDGDIFIAGENRLFKYQSEMQSFIHIDNLKQNYDIQLLAKDQNKKLWLGTEYDFGIVNNIDNLNTIDLTTSRLLPPARTIDILFNNKTNHIVRNTDLVSVRGVLDNFDNSTPVLRKVLGNYKQESRSKIIKFVEHDIKLYVALPDFSNSKLNQFRFRLNDKKWSEWSNNNFVGYTNLLGGDYLLQIQAKNHADKLTAAEYLFKVELYWYQTIWFKLFAVLSFALMTWLIVLVNTRRIKNKNRELEKVISEKTSYLFQQTQKLEKLSNSKTRFFSHVSHELRTPLTLTISPLEEIINEKYGKVSGTVIGAMNLVLQSAQRMQKLLNQVLDMNRMESGEFRLKLSTVELVNEIKLCVAPFELLAKKQEIELVQSFKPNELNVIVDLAGIKSIVNNLLGNAFKFTSRYGKIAIKLKSQSNRKANEKDSGHFTIEISDTGCGIDESDLPHIFDQYYQGDSKDIEIYSGTGIGLSMVREYVELHQGEIEVSSEPNIGTTFTVRLPFIRSENSTPSQHSTSSSAVFEHQEFDLVKSATNIHNEDCPSILIVEDNDELRQFLAHRIGEQFRIYEAENGQQALSIARERLPDVIISDIMMPVMNGHALCREIKSSPETDFIPVVMLTAKGYNSEIIEGIDLGADDYIVKPFSLPELLARINRLIESRKTLRKRYAVPHDAHVSHSSELNSDAKDILKPEVKSESADFLFKMKKIILQQNIEGLTVNQLAKAMAMDRTTLYRKIKNTTGESPVDLIRSTRLEEATKLLARDQGNISEIAYGVGFNSLGHFSRSFTSHFGLSPTEYKFRHVITPSSKESTESEGAV